MSISMPNIHVDDVLSLAEIVCFSSYAATFSGKIASVWPYPVTIAFAIPENGSWTVLQKEFPPQAVFDSTQFKCLAN